MFDTGKKEWNKFAEWPPKAATPAKIYLHDDGSIGDQPQSSGTEYKEFVSDPANPVTEQPREDIRLQFTPREYMTSDQRFAAAVATTCWSFSQMC